MRAANWLLRVGQVAVVRHQGAGQDAWSRVSSTRRRTPPPHPGHNRFIPVYFLLQWRNGGAGREGRVHGARVPGQRTHTHTHTYTHTHTHTHTFNGPLSGTTRVSRYQKAKTILDFTGARDSEWQWHQLGHMQVCTSLQTDNHASTPLLSALQAGCPSCRPTNSVEAKEIKNDFPIK